MSLATENENYTEARKQGAKKLFGLAVSEDSQALYQRIERPAPTKLAIEANRRIGADYAHAHNEESNAGDLLLYGLVDTQTFILNIIEQHPDLSFERAVEIAQHERTIQALGIIARQRPIISHAMIKTPSTFYDLSSDKQAIEMASTVIPSSRHGCAAIEIAGGEVAPWPIFERFAPWAAKLAIISHYDHKDD